MNEESVQNSQSHIILNEFTSFWALLDGKRFIPQPDTRLRHRFERVLNELIALNFLYLLKKIDAWARYFLITGRQVQEFQTITLQILDTPEFRATLSQLVRLQPSYNLIVQEIHECLLVSLQQHQSESCAQIPEYSEQLLSAYLQKCASNAAKRFFYQYLESRPHLLLSLEDCFQIASISAYRPLECLANFRFTEQNQVKTYAEEKMRGLIREEIQRQDRRERTNKLSTYGLLKNLESKKEVRQALIATLPTTNLIKREVELVKYSLILQAFKEIYEPRKSRTGKLQPPTSEELAKVSDRAILLRDRYLQQNQPSGESPNKKQKVLLQLAEQELNQFRAQLKNSTFDSQDVTKNLLEIEKAVRQLRSIEFDQTLNYTFSDENPPERTWEAIPDPKENALDILFLETHLTEIKQSICNAFTSLSIEKQVVLVLWLGMSFSQGNILQILGTSIGINKQYALSRAIEKWQKVILLQFVQSWRDRYPDLFTQENIDSILVRLKQPFDEALKEYCQSQASKPIREGLQALPSNQPPIPFLCNTLQVWLETTLNTNLQTCEILHHKLEQFVVLWLNDPTNGFTHILHQNPEG